MPANSSKLGFDRTSDLIAAVKVNISIRFSPGNAYTNVSGQNNLEVFRKSELATIITLAALGLCRRLILYLSIR